MIVILSLVVMLCGCESALKERLSPAGVTAAIRKGTTTKDQVRGYFGPPLSTKLQIPIAQPPGVDRLPVKYIASEIWAYRTTGYRTFKLNLPFIPSGPKATYNVIIYFDTEGKVLEYETEQREA